MSKPSTLIAAIWAIGLALLASTTANAQIVAFGASNTQGHGVGESNAYPAQLETMLRAKGRPMSVRNAGVFGDTTGNMLARLNSDIPAGTRIAILQFGGNDARRGVSQQQRQANIQAIVSQLRARGVRTVMADQYVAGALRGGFRQRDGIHLTVEGHQKVAAQLLPLVGGR